MGLNLLDELCFYRKYHNNPTNVLIHISCIPILLLSGLLILSTININISKSWDTSIFIPLSQYLTVGLLATIYYSGFYIFLDPLGYPVSLLLFCFYFGFKYLLLNQFVDRTSEVTYIALGIHGICWIAQFIGHGAFEKRKPALLDNLNQALLLAPFFVVFEMVFFFGYRKELQIEMDRKVAKILSDERKAKKH